MSKNRARNYPLPGEEPSGLKPPNWEHNLSEWLSRHAMRVRPKSDVRAFRLEHDGTTYDLQITQREYACAQHGDVREDGGALNRAFTLTLFGWIHVDTHHNPTVGRTYRWREGDHINGTDFGYKMGLNPRDVDAILGLLEKCGHNVKLISSVDGWELNYV